MSTPWKSLPPGVLETMEYLGGFGPTVNPEYREVKGYKLDADGEGHKAYLNAADLREMAGHMVIVADWLDERARSALAAAATAASGGRRTTDNGQGEA